MAETISTGEEKVGELCCQLPQRDPEQASLPAAPSGHHQLRMLEAAVPLLYPDATATSTGLLLLGPSGLWMEWPPLRGQLWHPLNGPEASATADSGPRVAPPLCRPLQHSLAAKIPMWLRRRSLSSTSWWNLPSGEYHGGPLDTDVYEGLRSLPRCGDVDTPGPHTRPVVNFQDRAQ